MYFKAQHMPKVENGSLKKALARNYWPLWVRANRLEAAHVDNDWMTKVGHLA
jgi:hypothetical protein